MFQGNNAQKFQENLALLFPNRPVDTFPQKSANLFLRRNALMSLKENARGAVQLFTTVKCVQRSIVKSVIVSNIILTSTALLLLHSMSR